jgi:hypothetical protein
LNYQKILGEDEYQVSSKKKNLSKSNRLAEKSDRIAVEAAFQKFIFCQVKLQMHHG